MLCLSITEPVQQVTIDLMKLNGAKISTVLSKKLSRGVYSIPISPNHQSNLSAGVYLVRLKTGAEVSIFKTVPIFKSFSTNSAVHSTLAKKAANEIVDTLCFTKQGYYESRRPISSYVDSLGAIVCLAIPQITGTDNIGNKDMEIFPPADSSITVTLTSGSMTDSLCLLAADSIIKPPLIASFHTGHDFIAMDFQLRIPFDTTGIPEATNLNIYLKMKVDSVTYPVFGTIVGDTFVATMYSMPDSAEYVLVYNPYMRALTANSIESGGLNKRSFITPDAGSWTCKHFMLVCDISYFALYLFTNKRISDITTYSETEEYLIKNVVKNAETIASLYDNTYKLKQPYIDCVSQLFSGKPVSISSRNSIATSSAFGTGDYMPIYMGMTMDNSVVEGSHYSPSMYFAIEDDALLHLDAKVDKPDKVGGWIRNHIAHEMLHGINEGYDAWEEFSPGNQSFLSSYALDEGIATVMGHTVDNNLQGQSGVFVREIEKSNYFFDQSLLDPRHILKYGDSFFDDENSSPTFNLNPRLYYANHDFFAYVGKRFFDNSLSYIGSMLEKLKSKHTNSGLGQLKLFYQGLDQFFRDKGYQGLWYVYSDFVRNRLYEHNEAAALRDGELDPSTVFSFNELLFSTLNVPENLMIDPGEDSISTVLTSIPPFSTRAVKINFTPQFINPYLCISVKGVPIMAESLCVVVYPEDGNTIKGKEGLVFTSSSKTETDKRILFDDTPDKDGFYTDTLFLANDAILDAGDAFVGNATVLIINNSYSTIEEVKVCLDQGIYTGKISFNYNYEYSTVDKSYNTKVSIVLDSVKFTNLFHTYGSKEADKSVWASSPSELTAEVMVDEYNTETKYIGEEGETLQECYYSYLYPQQTSPVKLYLELYLDSTKNNYELTLFNGDIDCPFSTNDPEYTGGSTASYSLPSFDANLPLPKDMRIIKDKWNYDDKEFENIKKTRDVEIELRRSVIYQ